MKDIAKTLSVKVS